jgi:hypothetical protein
MSYNGSGTFQINTSGQPVVTGTVISSSAFNALTADLATGLSTAITKDGQTATTVRIPFSQGINSSLVTDTTSGSTGSIYTAGGIGITKGLFVGTTLNYGGVTLSASVTGTGKMVLDNTPTLITPVLGVATATSVNKVSFTTPATAATLTIADGATLATSGAYSLTLTATAATNVTFPTTGTLATLAGSENLTNKTLTSPTIASANITTALTLTGAAGTSGQLLTSAGSGSAPTWSTPASAKVLQVVSTIKQDTFSMSGGSFVAITGLSASITPASASNKVLVQVSIGRVGPNVGTGATVAFQILRNSTVVGAGTPSGSQLETSFVSTSSTNGNYVSGGFAFQFLDSPSTTSSTAYSVQILGESSTTVYINRSYTGGTGSTTYEAASASTITVMEIAA